MPQKLTVYGGIDTLVHALESYVSIFATDYTKGLSREAVALTLKFLPRAYADGTHDYEARERIHSAATIAGMAFANAFLGICHSMAHKLGTRFHVPHGLANAALISHVIRYNASDRPLKQVGQAAVCGAGRCVGVRGVRRGNGAAFDGCVKRAGTGSSKPAGPSATPRLTKPAPLPRALLLSCRPPCRSTSTRRPSSGTLSWQTPSAWVAPARTKRSSA